MIGFNFNKSLKNSITFKVGIAIIGVLAIIFTLIVLDFRQAQTQEINKGMKRTILDVANQINAENKRTVNLVKTLAHYQEAGSFGDRQENLDYLQKFLSNHDDCTAVYFGYEPNADGQDSEYIGTTENAHDSRGRFIPYVYRTESGIKLKPLVDMSTSRYYQGPKQTGKTVLTEPYTYQGEMITETTHPIRVDGRFVGIAGIDRSLTKFQQKLKSLKSFKTARFYLLSSRNKVIGTSDEDKLLTRKLDEIDKYKKVFTPLIDSNQPKTAYNEQLNKVITYAPIEIGDWKVLMTVEQSEIMFAVNKITLKMIILGVIGVLIVCGLLYWLIDRYELLKEELEYNKLQVEFFANLSHELKTPLNLIFSSLQVLDLYQKNNFESEIYQKLSEYTGTIKQNSYRLLRLVNNLVDITKINSNSFDLNLKNSNVVEIIKKITYSVDDYITNRDRILEFDSDLESRIIACDPFSIERIILNLLSNAIKFTEPGDKISVNVSEIDAGRMVLISVKDTGIGIPEEKQDIIFKRFRQVDKSFTRDNEGSGIGLALVKLLVELHNGEITVNSVNGEFTEFNIKLPSQRLQGQEESQVNYKSDTNNVTNKVKIEFSDIYDL